MDINKNTRPTIAQDILRWNYKKDYPSGYFHTIFAAVPCIEFSHALTTRERDLEKGDLLVFKALEIIRYFRPQQWFLENPKTGFLKERAYMHKLPFIDVDYCQFSMWGYQKPTRIWGGTNIQQLASVVCQPSMCLNTIKNPNHSTFPHREKLGGYHIQYSTKQKGKIPPLLVEYLAGWKTIKQIKESLKEEAHAMAQGLKDKQGRDPQVPKLRHIYVIQAREGENEPESRVLRPRTNRPNYAENQGQDDEEYEPPHPSPIIRPYRKTIMDQNWDTYYSRCPIYREIWQIAKGELNKPWPEELRVYGDKLYLQELLCVPEELIAPIVIAHHASSGHLGVDKLIKECRRRYIIRDEKNWKEWAIRARRYCTVCASCDPPTWPRRGKIAKFPIPPGIWESIAIDIFSMPPEDFEGDTYNSIIICVDRHSGWIVAIPTNKTGLTSEKVAKLLYYKWTDLGGGIPSVITSDQGPQFTGKFFNAFCSLLGIRQAFTQAYRAQANGRAERAG